MRRLILTAVLTISTASIGSNVIEVHAATCTPSSKGKCTACKNCNACTNCKKNGGTCSVCKR